MALIDLTRDKFEETIENNEIVIFDFWASWCGPCKMFGPIFEEVSTKHPEIVFAKVNTEEEQELAAMFQVRSIPTVAMMRDQIVVFAQPGMMQASQLEEVIEQLKALDMDKVRADMAEQQKNA